VINSNLPSILHRFQVTADYMSLQIFASDGGGRFTLTPSLWISG